MNDRARKFKWHEDAWALLDMLVLCKFVYGVFLSSYDEVRRRFRAATDFYSSVTGWAITEEELVRSGERLVNMERLINLEYGVRSTDDTLPPRFFSEPLPSGPSKGQVNNLYPEIVKEYYKVRGWDSDEGVPNHEKLVELELQRKSGVRYSCWESDEPCTLGLERS